MAGLPMCYEKIAEHKKKKKYAQLKMNRLSLILPDRVQ